jgi:hypothetical protein
VRISFWPMRSWWMRVGAIGCLFALGLRLCCLLTCVLVPFRGECQTYSYPIFAPHSQVEDRTGLHLDVPSNTNYCPVWAVNQPTNMVAERMYENITNDVTAKADSMDAVVPLYRVYGNNAAESLWHVDMNNSGSFESGSPAAKGVAAYGWVPGNDEDFGSAFGSAGTLSLTVPDLSLSPDGGKQIHTAGTSVDLMPSDSAGFRTFAYWFKPLVAAVVYAMALGRGIGIVKESVYQVASGNQTELNKVTVHGWSVGAAASIAVYIPAVIGMFLLFSSAVGTFVYGLGDIVFPSITPTLQSAAGAAASGGSYATGLNTFTTAFGGLALHMFGVMWTLVSALFPVGFIAGAMCGVWVVKIKTDFFVMAALAVKANLAA